MISRFAPLIAAAALAATGAAAQVNRCIDANGKTTYTEAPCPTSAKESRQVVSKQAREAIRRNDEITTQEREDALLLEQALPRAPRPAVVARPQPQQSNPGGAVIMDSDPNQRIRQQDERNMQRRLAELDAGKQRQAERDARPAPPRPPTVMSNCNASGCWDTLGNRYNRTGDGSRLIGTDGRTCRDNGVRIICN